MRGQFWNNFWEKEKIIFLRIKQNYDKPNFMERAIVFFLKPYWKLLQKPNDMAAENDVTLEGLVCQNRMPEAIERLKSLIEDLKGDSYNSLIGLSGRLQAVRRDKIDGTADGSDPESNRIRAAFLSVLSDIREEIQSKVNFFKPIPRSQAQRDTLRDFVETVLSKKYDNIKPFNEGNTFIYFTATEKHSEMAVMVMILKSSDINEIMQNNQLSRIASRLP